MEEKKVYVVQELGYNTNGYIDPSVDTTVYESKTEALYYFYERFNEYMEMKEEEWRVAENTPSYGELKRVVLWSDEADEVRLTVKEEMLCDEEVDDNETRVYPIFIYYGQEDYDGYCDEFGTYIKNTRVEICLGREMAEDMFQYDLSERRDNYRGVIKEAEPTNFNDEMIVMVERNTFDDKINVSIPEGNYREVIKKNDGEVVKDTDEEIVIKKDGNYFYYDFLKAKVRLNNFHPCMTID
ncbi:MAG: hypothetical protein MJZ32_10605 [Bacteroidaceae bacterium]|nr:hypothetical protein [Bacteroidaceae bacterium]